MLVLASYAHHSLIAQLLDWCNHREVFTAVLIFDQSDQTDYSSSTTVILWVGQP